MDARACTPQAVVDASAVGIVHRDIKSDNIVVDHEERRSYQLDEDTGLCRFR